MDEKILNLLSDINNRLNKMDERFDKMDERLDKIEENIEIIKEHAEISRVTINNVSEFAEEASHVLDISYPVHVK